MANNKPREATKNTTSGPDASGPSVSPLPGVYELSPMDQSMKRTYIKLILCFPLYVHPATTDGNQLVPTISSVSKGYLFALNRWPFLKGVICPHSDPELRALGMLQIEVNAVTRSNMTVVGAHHVTRPDGYRKVPSVWIKGSAHSVDDPDTPRPPVTLKISSIMGEEHGSRLLLGLEFHRAVFDGTSINMFLRHFARGCFPQTKANSLGKFL